MNMRGGSTSVAVACLALGTAPAGADEGHAQHQAVALVKKGVAFIRANGAGKACAAITAGDAPFVDRDLYLVVYGLDGRCLAHGANPTQVGRDRLDLGRVDDTPPGEERAAPADAGSDRSSGSPASRATGPRVIYCEGVEEAAAWGAPASERGARPTPAAAGRAGATSRRHA